MLTPIQIAKIAHEANRAYCRSLGDDSQKGWDETPYDIRDSVLRGVEDILSGEITSPEDSHNSWLINREAAGWTLGPVKDYDTKKHPNLVPYNELEPEQQMKDFIFLGVVEACQNIPSTQQDTPDSTDESTGVEDVSLEYDPASEA